MITFFMIVAALIAIGIILLISGIGFTMIFGDLIIGIVLCILIAKIIFKKKS